MADIKVSVVREEPITIKRTDIPKEPADAAELRQIYLNIVKKYIGKLKRSVCKDYAEPPSYEGYQDEIRRQQDLVNQVFFLQNCRAAIELALQDGEASVEGRYISTKFMRQPDGKILVTEIEH